MKHPAQYFKNTKDRRHHPLLELALLYIKKKKKSKCNAVDFGSGTGGDTLYLLEKGYEVVAVDIEQMPLSIIEQRARAQKLPLPILMCGPMENFRHSNQFDLITSNLALPYVGPTQFIAMWSKVVQYIRFGGIFSGQLFGKSHEWAADSTIKFLGMKGLQHLFKGWFDIIHFSEKKGREVSALGGTPFWHQYDIVAKRVPISPEKPLLTFYNLNIIKKYALTQSLKHLKESHQLKKASHFKATY